MGTRYNRLCEAVLTSTYNLCFVERLPVLYHSADYISFPLGSLGTFGIFENGVLLMYTLQGVSSVANFITAYEESQ